MSEPIVPEVLPPEKAHHKYSPSGLGYLEVCPCFEQKEDPNKVNEAADNGQRGHAAIEHNDPERIVDEYEKECVLKCMKFKQDMQEKFPEGKVINEMALSTTHHHGTDDYVLLNEATKEAVIADWKLGVLEVEAPDTNIQFWSYANMLMLKYTWIEKLHVYGVQPKVHEKPTYQLMTREWLPRIDRRICNIIASVENPDKKPCRNSKSCDWCTRKATCSAWAETGIEIFGNQYGVKLPEQLLLGIDHEPEDLANILFFCSILEDFCKQKKKQIGQEALTLQKQIPGCSLINRKGNLKVGDVAMLVEVAKSYGADPEEMLKECCNVSAKKVTQLLHDKYNVDIGFFTDQMEDSHIFERGSDIVFLKKKSAKVKPMEELKKAASENWNQLEG